MPTLHPVVSRASLAALAVAVLSAGCASVDLNRRYDPPPVRSPMPPPAAAPAPLPSLATSQPVTPGQSVGQALPPYGAPPAPPPASAPPAPVDAPAAQSNLSTLTTRLDGASAVPPARSAGSGQLDALYDANTRLFRWKANWTGLSGQITGVQFHGPAGSGQVGPPAMVWPGPFGPAYEGRATLTPQQAADLLEGLWYVNVSTTTFPSGEVRGQLRVVR